MSVSAVGELLGMSRMDRMCRIGSRRDSRAGGGLPQGIALQKRTYRSDGLTLG
jgi:hypothetical protein